MIGKMANRNDSIGDKLIPRIMSKIQMIGSSSRVTWFGTVGPLGMASRDALIEQSEQSNRRLRFTFVTESAGGWRGNL